MGRRRHKQDANEFSMGRRRHKQDANKFSMGHRRHKQDANEVRDSEDARSKKFICFDDLKVELKKAGYPYPISQTKDIQKQINCQNEGRRKNAFQIRWENVIPVQQAKKIFYELTGKDLDLRSIKYDYEYVRDTPFSQVFGEDFSEPADSGFSKAPDSIVPNLIKEIEHWYLSILSANIEQNSQKNSLLGIVCSGGFLRGKSRGEDDPFIFPLQSGINVLIGTRGSGKSTSLNMLSLLLDSSMQRSPDDDISEWLMPIRRSFSNYGNGRVWRFLKEYGVKKYACYFYEKESTKLYVLYTDLEKNIWCLLCRKQNGWSLNWKEPDPVEIFPEMLVLRQGDVFRITDSRNKLVINQILEGLNSDIKDKRRKLFNIFDTLTKKYKSHRKSSNDFREVFPRLKIDNQLIARFVNEQRKEIEHFRILSQEVSNNNFRFNTVSIKFWISLPVDWLVDILFLHEFYIAHVLNHLESYLEKYDRVKWTLPRNFFIRLIKAGEAGLWCLYVGLISSFLKQKIQRIQFKMYVQEESQLSLTQHIEKPRVVYEDEQESHQPILQRLNEIFSVLENRLSIILNLQDNLKSFYEWSDDVKDICNQSTAFFRNQFELICDQSIYCQEIEKKLSFLKEQKIRFITTANDHLKLAESLNNNENCYNFLFEEDLRDFKTTFTNQDLERCLELVKAYNVSIFELIEMLENIETSINYEQVKSDYIDFPVSVELKQGEDYRAFPKLSYGQKSSVILTIILIMTKAKLIVIDQPEDNLDIDATLKILTPALLKVREDRSVTIATHDFNLVRGLESSQPNIFVMDSPNEFGGILSVGGLDDLDIKNSVFKILEGGQGLWNERNKYFRDVAQEDLVPNEDSMIETVNKFLKQSGATSHFSERRWQITSIKNNLKTYTPIPVVVVNSEPTGQHVTELLKYSKQLNNERQTHAGILLYRESPDALFRIRMTEVRISEQFILIPISLAAVEQSLLDNSVTGLLSEYSNRYLSFDLFDDRNAIGDTLSFFGRTQILNRLEEGLKKRQGIGLFGLRKSGKTSLLLQIISALRRHPVVYVDLQAYGGKLYYGVEIFNQILHQLSKLTDGEISQPFEKDFPAANVASKFIDRVTEIALILQDREYELPVICLLDEIERILPLPTDSREKVEEFNAVFGALRVLSQQKRNLGLLVADVHPDCNRINHWSQSGVPTNPVFNFFKEEFVPPFSLDETRTMIDDIGKLMGRKFDEETLVAIHQESGGHPFISRQIASLLCNKITLENHGLITHIVSMHYLTKPFTYSAVLKDYMKESIWSDLKKRKFDAAMAILKLLACNDEFTKESPFRIRLGIFTGVLSTLFLYIKRFFSSCSKNQGLTEHIILEQLSNYDLSKSQCSDALLWLESVGLVVRHRLAEQNHYLFQTILLSRWLLMQMSQKEVEQWRIN